MCVAIPTHSGELSSLASKPEGSLKDFMNHFVELTSAQQFDQICGRPPMNTTLNSPALQRGLVAGTTDEHGTKSSK